MKSKPQIGSAAQVASFPAGVHSVKNAPGLFLRKSANGSGSWFFRYYNGTGDKLDGSGKTEERREMGLGSAIGHGAVTLAEARDRALALRKQRADGVPILTKREARKKAENLAQAEAKKITFRHATDNFLTKFGPTWRGRYSRSFWLNPIIRYAHPVIGDMLLDDIHFEHVEAVMDAASDVPDTGQRVRQRIETILNYATKRGQRSSTLRNPAEAKLHNIGRRPADREHYRRIELDDAPEAFRRVYDRARAATAVAAWSFMILTATRPSEALRAKWSEIDLDKKLWTIPKERMKANRPHVVPLSSLALAVLKRQATVRTGEAVFPGPNGSPLSYNPFATATAKAGIDAGAPHSWRSIFRDACGDRLRVDRDLAEAALSHALGAVEGAYRRETAIEARRPVMEAYAQWLIGSGTDVIAFPARA